MLAVLLGSAVFCWGLGYKLSLYQSSSPQHAEPAARLLSQKERPAALVPFEALFRSGKSSQHPSPHSFFSSDLAHRPAFPLDVDGAREALARASTSLSPLPRRNPASSPRAPPVRA